MVFKIFVTKFNCEDNYSVFTVNKLTNDKDVIKTVLATSPHLEDMLSEGDAPLSLLDGSHGNNESKEILSVTADNGTPGEIVSSPAASPQLKRSVDLEVDVLIQSSTSKDVGASADANDEDSGIPLHYACAQDINDHLFYPDYFQDRAILVPTNEEVDNINDYMISRLNSNEVSYFSSDRVCEGELADQFEESLYTPKLLNSLKVSGWPHHKLTLKIGVPIMLIRNIDQSKGLCNVTRLQVTRLGEHVIEVLVISGKNVGDLTYIP